MELDMGNKQALLVLKISILLCSVVEAGAYEASEAGPKYFNLRYDEDFSYLADPNKAYTPDFWDPIKWIQLSEGWTLTLGGQARLRFESETNKRFGDREPSHDSFFLQRYFIHTDLRHSDGLRFFVQGKFAHVNNRDRGGAVAFEDHADFHQAFMDVPTVISELPLSF